MSKTIQDREPNFRNIDGRLYLLKCFKCDPKKGKRNYLFTIASGLCFWCGWKEKKRTKKYNPINELTDIIKNS